MRTPPSPPPSAYRSPRIFNHSVVPGTSAKCPTSKGPESKGPGTKGSASKGLGNERSGVLKVRRRKVRKKWYGCIRPGFFFVKISAVKSIIFSRRKDLVIGRHSNLNQGPTRLQPVVLSLSYMPLYDAECIHVIK
jgi:hypothetical protein